MLVFEDAIVISMRPVSVSFAMRLRSRPGQLHHRPARPWRDTGSGIPPRVLERMFDPFFTTKRVGDGTGLGLALVHGIVADFGGGIDVATRVGTGTTFTIWLPAAGEIPVLLAEPPSELPRGNGETVMIVDDERAQAAGVIEVLRKPLVRRYIAAPVARALHARN